jgi:hypothetical protein
MVETKISIRTKKPISEDDLLEIVEDILMRVSPAIVNYIEENKEPQ